MNGTLRKYQILCLYVALLLFYLAPTLAQEYKVKVPYSRHIPALIRQQVPNGGKTKFFGVWNQNSNSRFYFHFYSAPTPQNPILCKLDIFQQVPRSSNKIKQVNSITLDNKPNLFRYITGNVPGMPGSLRYGADILWINQKEKKLPLLRIDVINPHALDETTHDYIMITCAAGWDATPRVQYFEQWGNSYEYCWVTFDQQDKLGYMVVTTWHDTTGIGNGNPTQVEYRWNGANFSPPPTTDNR